MKALFLFTGIVFFICCSGLHSAKGNPQVEGKSLKREVAVVNQEPKVTPSESPAENPDETKDTKQKKRWTFKVDGDLTNYFISESHAFFGDSERHWLETSLRLNGTASFKHFTAGVSLLGVKTTGQDSFGTGTMPAGSALGTKPPGSLPSIYVDQAYIQLDQIGRLPLKATLGRQHITIGSQFLIGDGVYDGFSSSTRQGVFHSPRKGFDALRVEWDINKTHFDSFLYRVDPTWDGGGKRDGILGGVDVSHTFAKVNGTYAAGLFYRSSRSNLDNDMAIVDLRGEQPLKLVKGLKVSGELALEFAGRCRNAAYCTSLGQKMNEQSFHAEVAYQNKTLRFQPFAEAGYVFYSKDFTPIATGFSDWGKWYLGNQIDWIIFGTNTKIVRAQVGMWPTSTIRLRTQFHNTRQVENTGTSTGGSLANEVSFIGEWYPQENLWFNLSLGHSRPGLALKSSGLTNPFAFLNAGASPVGTRNSIDVVFATSWHF
jgi:hypothetical protein